MKEVIDNIKMLTNALGYKVFIDISKQRINEDKILYFYTKSFKGLGIETNDGFMVLKGSIINKASGHSLNSRNISLRKRLMEQNIIDENYTFTENYVFSSSSTAGCIISGYSVSGPQSWKNKDGKSIKELNEEIINNIKE